MTTRRSLHIGINYPGSDAQLAGCVNDALAWQTAAAARGYQTLAILDGEATRDVLVTAMAAAVTDTKSGDRVLITYSGHGTWVPDLDGDEADHRDEAICPVDFRRAGVITDDTLYEVFRAAPRGVRMVFVADSCFSGTLRRFAPPVHAGGDGFALPGPQRRPRFLPPGAFLEGDDWQAAELAERAPTAGRFRRSALVMSACSDTQVTYDTVIDGRPCGLYTTVALAALTAVDTVPERPPTYRAWQREIRRRLPSVDYPDVTPQMDGTADQKRWPVA